MKNMVEAIASHRSVRKFDKRAIPAQVMQQLIAAATRASTTGGMQLYSIIVTEDEEIKAELSPCHFGQPMVCGAAAVVTFCADVNRFSEWCRQRDAEPGYDNFMWFINGAIDALLASENFSLEAENQGLGICYLGTTTYTARDIIRILELPRGVVPITTVVVGYPEQPEPPLTDRLPLAAVVHYGKYQAYTPQVIDELWAATEASEQTARLLEENNLPNLARIFTERRYKKDDSLHFSQEYLQVLRMQGFVE